MNDAPLRVAGDVVRVQRSVAVLLLVSLATCVAPVGLELYSRSRAEEARTAAQAAALHAAKRPTVRNLDKSKASSSRRSARQLQSGAGHPEALDRASLSEGAPNAEPAAVAEELDASAGLMAADGAAAVPEEAAAVVRQEEAGSDSATPEETVPEGGGPDPQSSSDAGTSPSAIETFRAASARYARDVVGIGADSTGDGSGQGSTGYGSGRGSTGYGSGERSTGVGLGADGTGYGNGARSTGVGLGQGGTNYGLGAGDTGYGSGSRSTGYGMGAGGTGYGMGANSTGWGLGQSGTGFGLVPITRPAKESSKAPVSGQ